MSTGYTRNRPSLALLLGATGVVFGDIGTSPLYAFRESFVGSNPLAINSANVLGVLSMLIWALILVITVKYVYVTMRADNRGESGSFALPPLIERVNGRTRALSYIAMAALIATALFDGDAVITPAISILSAVQGLTLLDPGFKQYIIPVTLVIIAGLLAIQRFGPGVMGTLFGPIMVVQFATIAGLGAVQVVANPQVIAAVNPAYAAGFFMADPVRAFFTLVTVVLAVTGAEALYADMGHFGRRSISRAQLFPALPALPALALVLCYAGQSAMVLADPPTIGQSFYEIAPASLLVPLLIIAAAATVIASQSIISGAFSITQQAVQLGYLPRMSLTHTSSAARQQIYVPIVNWMLFIALVALVLGFGSSSPNAAAFGLAVTATMVLTTLINGFVIFWIQKWNLL